MKARNVLRGPQCCASGDLRHTRGVKFPGTGAERVARALLEGGPATAAELACRLEISPGLVRRHLDSLTAQGLVDASDRRPFGPEPVRGRGRPARVFALTDAGSHAFDLDYDDLALAALAFLEERGGQDAIREFARQRARTLVTRHQAVEETLPGEERLEALAEALTADGFVANTVQTDAGPQLCQHHCPVRHVAARYPQLCEAETEAFEEILDTHVLRLATIGRGDGICTTLVPALMTRRNTA